MRNPINIKNLFKAVPPKVDLVITSASFENRCRIIADALSQQVPCKQFLVFYNSNEYKEINDMALDLVSTLPNAREIELNTTAPVNNAIAINKVLNEVFQESVQSVFLDTTTFTHETLLIIIKMLYEKRRGYDELYIGYNCAKNYSVNVSEHEMKWLTSGISTIRSVVGYPGVNSPARPNHLLVLFGFESDRTQKLIDFLEFEAISLGFGHKEHSISSSHQAINVKRHKSLIIKYSNADQFTFSLTDPYCTQKDIAAQIVKYPNHNTVIAAMNNKISTIGASLVAIENSRIQLIYVKPVEYNIKGYSEPSDTIYIYNLVFD